MGILFSLAWFNILKNIRKGIMRYKLKWGLKGRYVIRVDDYLDSYIIYRVDVIELM